MVVIMEMAGSSSTSRVSDFAVDGETKDDQDKSSSRTIDPEVASMLDTIATVAPETLFKSMQIDDPDLSVTEKRQLATDILIKSPSQFLARFGKFIKVDDLFYFERFAKYDYAVEFYVNEIRNVSIGHAGRPRYDGTSSVLFNKTGDCGSTIKVDVQVKNRRYEALRRLVDKGEYFSNSEMKVRNPLMFEQMVGQYMSKVELNELQKIDNEDIKLSTLLMAHMDRDEEQCLRRRQQACFDVEEDESSSDEEQDEDAKAEDNGIKWPSSITDEERKMLKEEFLSNMYQSFLDGKDTDFDYSAVDENMDYDSVDARQQDAEDKYFDAEDANTIIPVAELAKESMDYDGPIQNFL